MISRFVASYGTFAVFIGTLLEGETVLFAAGFAVHRGLLDGWVVWILAVSGATLGDQLAFLLGRWQGERLFLRFPRLARHKEQVDRLLEKYDIACVIAVRFLYGLRIAGPIILGMSELRVRRFAALNLLGASIWASLVLGAGYLFGASIGMLLANIKAHEGRVIALIVLAGLLASLIRRISR